MLNRFVVGVLLYVVSGLVLVGIAGADPPATDSALEFGEPFAPLSATEAESKLVFLLITDEDPFVWSKAEREKVDGSRLGGGADLWCGAAFRRSFDKMIRQRPDLRGHCLVQRVAAGLPATMSGGIANAMPRRVVLAICDGNYRLLHFCVGLPHDQELLSAIEDAQENRALLTLHEQSASDLGTQLWERAKKRVRRSYREPMERYLNEDPWDSDLVTIDQAWIDRLAGFARMLQPIYLFDAKLRFGLSDATDRIRLLVLEQHLETRLNWCASVAPFVVGRPMEQLMSPLLDVIWGFTPVIDVEANSHPDLIDWFETSRQSDTVVLAVLPSLFRRDIVWPPPNVSGRVNIKNDWAALETAMSQHSFRTVDLEELATLLKGIATLDDNVLLPSPVRYVVFEPTKKQPFYIRESDQPVKFMRRLK